MKKRHEMTEYEKMLAGKPFSVRDPEVDALKLHALEGCQKLNSISVTDSEALFQSSYDIDGEEKASGNRRTGHHWQ